MHFIRFFLRGRVSLPEAAQKAAPLSADSEAVQLAARALAAAAAATRELAAQVLEDTASVAVAGSESEARTGER